MSLFKRRSLAATRITISAMLLAVVLSIIPAGHANAVTPVWNASDAYGGFRTGYFTGKYDNSRYGPDGSKDEGYVLPNGLPSSAWSVNAFYDYLRGEYFSGDYRRYTGASYLVHSMLGHQQPKGSRDVSAADWADFLNRLKGVTIQWSKAYTAVYDVGMNESVDVYRVNYASDPGQYALFYDKAGNLVYAINHACANPDGVFGGLPEEETYSLTPTITVNPVTSGGLEDITPSGSVSNGGQNTSPSASWEVTRFTLASGAAIPSAGVNASNPTTHYGNKAKTVQTGSKAFAKGVSTVTLAKEALDDSFNIGERVCFTLSVKPYSQDNSNWSHGVPACVTIIGDKPKVQVRGGDLILGRETPYNAAATSNVITSTSSSNAGGKITYYGSWAEYAIIPSGKVIGMASGAGYAGGDSSSDACGKSVLTFVNRVGAPGSCDSSQIGKFTSTVPVSKLASQFPTTRTIAGASIDLKDASLFGISHSVKSNLNITNPSKTSIPKGKWLVINDAGATVTIKDDITYDPGASLNNANDIPQVVIIAKNIIIADNVKNVDAWLIAIGGGSASGYINTCASVTAGAPTGGTLNSTKCDQQLKINGPVFANKLYLYRTKSNATGMPSEIFNLRADAYLWASVHGSTSSRVPTMSTKELPPRF